MVSASTFRATISTPRWRSRRPSNFSTCLRDASGSATRHDGGRPPASPGCQRSEAMPQVIRIERHGGPEVMEWIELPMPAPGPGEVLLRQTAIGLNFVDVYQRTGLYPTSLPAVMGSEGAGVVEALGSGVTAVNVGDRVVYQGAPGAYAETRVVPAERLIRLPAGIDDRTAAAAFLKGTTVSFLLLRTFKVARGHTVLFHAAAGGVGQIACQWAKALGATVIGTVGSNDKMAVARANGCDHVINYR